MVGLRRLSWICVLALALVCLSAVASRAQSFLLRDVKFTESAYLSEEELNEVVAPWVGRQVTFDDLIAMMGAIRTHYLRSGIVTAEAVLPPQTIDGGVLRVDLIEARIDRVEIDGFARTRPEFLRRTISLEPGERPDFAQIERDLRIYELSHDIMPQIAFRPGDAVGTTTAVIQGEDTKPVQLSFSLDNFGREETGQTRGTVQARWSSVTGWRDSLLLQLEAARDSRSVAVRYSRPVDDFGGRAVLGLSRSDSALVVDPASGALILSNNTSLQVGYRRPFGVSAASAWFGEGGALVEGSRSSLGGVPFADMRLSELYGTIGWSSRAPGRSFGFDLGLRLGRAEAVGTALTEGAYAILSGGVSYARQVGQGAVADISLRAQLAPRANLPVARVFSVGGVSTVRGYPVSVQSGDSGALMRVQLSKLEPWTFGAENDWAVTPTSFFDLAHVVPYRQRGAIGPRPETLAAIGGGFQINWNNKVNGVMLAALPLSNTSNFAGRGKPVFYFGVDYGI